MGKPKRFKKLLSFFLAFLMLMSSLTVGFTAFAGSSNQEWTNSAGEKLSDHKGNGVTSNGAALNMVANALHGNNNYAGDLSHYQNLTGVSVQGGSGYRGTFATDDEYGDIYDLVKGAWNAVLEMDTKTNQFNNLIKTQVENVLKEYMGNDWNPAHTTFNGYDAWDVLMDYIVGAYASFPSASIFNYAFGFNVVVDLHHDYYLWNSYADSSKTSSQNITDLLPEDGILVTQKGFYWKSTYYRSGTKYTYYTYDGAEGKPDVNVSAILVRANELKDFAKYIGEDFEVLKKGYEQYLEHDFTFNGITSAYEEAELTNDRLIELYNKTIPYMNAVLNGTPAYTNQQMTPASKTYSLAQANNDMKSADVTVNLDSNATKDIFEHFYGTSNDVTKYIRALETYLVENYKNAVETVKANLYNSDNSLKSDLSLDELRNIKAYIDNADSIYASLDSTLQTAVNSYKNNLTGYKQDFVPLWNKAIANAYDDQISSLEKALEGKYAKFGEAGYVALVDTGLKPQFVKTTLDTANGYFNEFIIVDSNGNISSTTYDKATGVIGDAKLAEDYEDYKYVLEKYERYLYDDFVNEASKLDPYWEYSGSKVVALPGDYFHFARLLPIINRVVAKYNLLNSTFKGYPEAKLYYEQVIPVLRAALAAQNLDKYKVYDLNAPTNMSWDNSQSYASITQLISNLSDFIDDPEMNKALLGYTLNKEGLGELIKDYGPWICNTVMQFLYPEIKKALKSATLGKITVAGITVDLAYNLGMNAYLGVRNKKMSGLYPDPDTIQRSSWFSKKWPTNVTVLNKATDNWDDVNWDAMDWHIDENNYGDGSIPTAPANSQEAFNNIITNFGDALAGALVGGEGIVKAILGNQTCKLSVDVAVGAISAGIVNSAAGDMTTVVIGSRGYEGLVLPILEFLGCYEDAESRQYLKNSSYFEGTDMADMIRCIVDPLVRRLGNILEGNTFDILLDMLPNLAYAIQNNRLGEMLMTINNSINNTETGGNKLNLGLWNTLGATEGILDSSWLNGFLSEKLNVDFTIPDLPLLELAYIAPVKDDNVVALRSGLKRTWLKADAQNNLSEKALTCLVYYIDEFVIDNQAFFKDIIENGANFNPDVDFDLMGDVVLPLVESAFDSMSAISITGARVGEMDFAADFYKLFTAYKPEDFSWDATRAKWVFTPNKVNYDEVKDYYTKDDVEYFIQKLNEILNNILPNIMKAEKAPTITAFLEEQLYSSRRADELFNTFYRVFGSDFLQKIYTIGSITIDGTVKSKISASPKTLYDNLATCDVPEVRQILADAFSSEYFVYNGNTIASDKYGMPQHKTYDLKYEIDGKESQITVVDENGKPITMEYEGSFIITKKVAVPTEDGKSYTLEEREVYSCFDKATYVGKIIDQNVDPEDPTNLSTKDTWNVNGNATKLKNIVTALLYPFNDLATLLLAGETEKLMGHSNDQISKVSIVGVVTLMGNNGYEKALMPLFQALGMNPMAADEFNRDLDGTISNIINMVFKYLSDLALDPAGKIISAIPSIAYWIDNGGIQMLVENFFQPLGNIISAVTDVVQITELGETSFVTNVGKIGDYALESVVKKLFSVPAGTTFHWNNVQHELGALINAIIPTIELDKKDDEGNKIQATDSKTGLPAVDKYGNPVYEKETFNITIPEIPWARIAGCAEKAVAGEARVEGTVGTDVIVTIIRFVWDDVVVGANREAVEGILNNVLGKETYALIEEHVDIFGVNKAALKGDHIVQLLCTIAKVMDTSAFGASGTILQKIVGTVTTTDPKMVGDYVIQQSDVVYPDNPSEVNLKYAPENVRQFVNVLTNIVMSVLENYADLSLAGVAQDGIYTSALVASIAKVVYPLFDDSTVGNVLGMLGIEVVNLKELYKLLIGSGYEEVAAVVLADMTADESAYPGRPSTSWKYTEQLDADGNVVKNDKDEVQYEWANIYWAKNDKGAYIYTDSSETQHVMTYWVANEDGTYKKNTDGTYFVREKTLADINWDYCVDNKLFHVYVDAPENETDAEYAARMQNCQDNLNNALTTVLAPFIPFVNFLLNAGTINVAGVAPLIGTHGYRNVVKPLLDLLGCNNVVDAATYEANALEGDQRSVISDIITPLLSKVNEIFGADAIGPVRAILNIVPDLANFVNMGGVQELIYELLYPFISLFDTVLDILTRGDITSILDAAVDIVLYSGLIGGSDDEEKSLIDKIISGLFGSKEDERITWANAHTKIFSLVDKIFSMLTINGVTLEADVDSKGNDKALNVTIQNLKIGDNLLNLELAIPMFDLAWVAGIGPGRYTNDASAYDEYAPEAVKKRTDSFLVIVQYLWKILQINKDALIGNDGILASLLGNAYGTAYPYIASVLDVELKNITVNNLDNNLSDVVDSANEIVAALIQFTESTDSSHHYADTKTGYSEADNKDYDADADIPDLTWDKFFEYSSYTDSTKHIAYPVIPQVAADTTHVAGKNYTEADVTVLINSLTSIIQTALSKVLGTTVEELVVDTLYTDDIVAQISKLVCSLADNATVASILPMFGVDLSSDALIKMLNYYGYVDLAAKVSEAVKNDIPLSQLQWFDEYETDDAGNETLVKEGIAKYWYVESEDFEANVWDKSDFKNPNITNVNQLTQAYRFTRAIVVALSPFSGLINVLFNAGTEEFFGAIEITGTRGYRNAVKPILDVLGCDTVSKDQFVADSNTNTDYVIYNIINPVIGKLGDVMADPLNEALDIFASLAAFVDNGGLQKAIEELLYPITQMFGPIIKLATRGVEELNGSTDIFSIALSFVDLGENVTWDNLHKEIPNIAETLLKIRVITDKETGRYVRVYEKQVATDDKVNTIYYTVSSEPKDKLENGEEESEEEIEEVDVNDTKLIAGVEINGEIYELNIKDIGIDQLFEDLAYSMVNNEAANDAKAKDRRAEALVSLYRLIRRTIDVNEADFITPLVESLLSTLPETAQTLILGYVDNILAPKSGEGDNILITLIRIAEKLGTALDFDVDAAADQWKADLTITADEVTAVSYAAQNPEKGDYATKYTQAKVQRAIETIWGTVDNVISKYLLKDDEGKATIADFALENFLNDELLSTIAKGVFSLADNDTVTGILNIFDITLNKTFIVNQLKAYGYTELAENINKYSGKLADIPWFVYELDDEGNRVKDKDGNDIKVLSANYGKLWNVTDADSFSKGLIVIISPFANIVKVLTTNESVPFSDKVAIKGSYGYTAAIKPFLDALGVNTIHRDDYRADVQADSDNAIIDIINPLIDRANEIMHYPVRNLLSTLPTLANFINVGGIQTAIENLLVPFVSLLDPVVDLLVDNFGKDVKVANTIYQIAFEIVDGLLLDGALADAGFGWSNLFEDISKLANTLFPTLYTAEVDGKLYKASYNEDKGAYFVSILKTDANGDPVKDDNGKDVYDAVEVNKVNETENGIMINGKAYSITIPENINGFLADLAGCQGVTAVDTATGSLKSAKNLDSQLRPDVAVTLLSYIWDGVVAENFNSLINPLLEDLVDPLMDNPKNLYSDVIRNYIATEEDRNIFARMFARITGDEPTYELNYVGSEFTDLVVGLVNSLDASDADLFDWEAYIKADRNDDLNVEYPAPYQSEDVKVLITVITNIAMSCINAFLDFSPLGLAEDSIYTSELVVTLAKTLYPLFDSSAVQSVFEILGVEGITLENLAKVLEDAGYPRTAQLVSADITNADAEVDGYKVNWKTVNQKDADGNDVKENNKVVTIEVNRFWATDEDGKYLYTDADSSYDAFLEGKTHVMTYWVADEDGKWVLNEDGTYAVREKQFADINWDPCVEGKFFNIATDPNQNVDDYRNNMVRALTVVLYPLVDLAEFMFNNGELDIAGVAHFKGTNGYANAIYPLLQVLGCSAERNGLLTPEAYAAAAADDDYKVIENILAPLFSRINNILVGSDVTNGEAVGPVRAVLNMIPNFALFIEKGGVQKLVEQLVYPVANIADVVIGVLSKDNTSLFNVAFDAFVGYENLDASKHTSDSFEGTGLTDRIIEKLIVAVFNPSAKTEDVVSWDTAHEHIFEIVAGFVKPNEKKDNVYLSVNENGALEINNITLTIPEKKDDDGNVTTAEKKVTLPAIQISSINDLLSDLADLGAPIPWKNGDKFDGMGTDAVQRRTDAFVLLWQYIWGIVEDNHEALEPTLVDEYLNGLLGNTFTYVKDYIYTILGRNANEVLSAFIQVTKALDTSDVNEQKTWDAYFAQVNDADEVIYPVKNYAANSSEKDELYTSNDVAKTINTISGIAQSVFSAATGNTLNELAVDLLYNDEVIAVISNAIFSIYNNSIVQAILPLLDPDFSVNTLVARLQKYGYKELAEVVANNSKDLSKIEWFTETADGKKVATDIAKLWYVTDENNKFEDNVWKQAEFTNPNLAITDVDLNYRFTRAIVIILTPFSTLINTFINARTSTIFGEIQLTGSYGYRNAIKPLLEALGTYPMSVNDFNAYIDGTELDNGETVQANQDYVIFNIINPLLSKVDSVIKNPGQEIFATIATLGSFIGGEAFAGKGNLQSAIELLLTPVLRMVDPIVKLATDKDSLFTILFNILGIEDSDGKLVTWNNVHEHVFDIVAHFLKANEDKSNVYAQVLNNALIVKNITINGNAYDLTVPEYDLSKLKSCTVDDALAKRASDTFVTVFRYIRSIINVNSDKEVNGAYVLDESAFITKLVKDLINNDGTWEKIKPYLSNVLCSQNDEILVTVIRMFMNLDQSDLLQTVPEITDHWNELLDLGDVTESGVDYGDLTVDDVTAAIDTLKTTIHSVLGIALPDVAISEITATYLYKSSIPDMLAKIIFPLADNTVLAEILNIFNVNISKEFISSQLRNYGYVQLADKVDAAEKLANLWAEGADDISGLWYVENEEGFEDNVWNHSAVKNPEVLNGNQLLDAQYRFARALVVVVSPFRELIGVLTQKQSMNIFIDVNDPANDVKLTGEYGYSNAIKPFLEALGIDAMDGDTYRSMAGNNPDYILYNIIYPILNRVDVILEMPVRSILDTLPVLAQYIGNGGLQESITNLLYPITKIASPIVRLVLGEVRSETEITPSRFYDLVINAVAYFADVDALKGVEWKTIHEWDNIKALVNGVLDMLDAKLAVTINGVEYPITIPAEGPFDKLARCQFTAGLSDDPVDEVRANTLLAFLEYVWYVVQENEEDFIKPLVENLLGDDTYSYVSKYVNNFLGSTQSEFAVAIVEVLAKINNLDCSIDWTSILFDGYESSAVTYPLEGIKKLERTVSAEDIKYAIDQLSSALDMVILELVNSASNATSLEDLVANVLYTNEIPDMLGKTVFSLLSDNTVANVLALFGIELDVTKFIYDSVTDKASFVEAISSVLSTFDPVLEFLLNGKALVVADGALVIPGDNGYANAIKPLLDVIGCTTISGEAYALAADADDKNIISNILTPLLDRVDVILSNPVNEVLGMVAGLANFIDKSGIQIMLQELVHPITNIINPIVRLASDRDKDGNLTDVNIFDIVFDLVKGIVGAPEEATWMTVQNYIFDIVIDIIPNVYYYVETSTDADGNEVTNNVFVTKTSVDGKDIFIDSEGNEVTDKDIITAEHSFVFNGNPYKITIPSEVNGENIFKALAKCGTLNDAKTAIDGNSADVLVTVLRYVWAVVEANEDGFVIPLLKSILDASLYSKIEKYLTELFNSNADQVIVALIETLKGLKKDGHDVSDEWAALLEKTSVEVKYPNGLTVKNVTDAIYQLTDILNAVIPMVLNSTGYDTLKAFVADKIYTPNFVEIIAKALSDLGYEVDENGNKVESSLNKTLKDVVGIDFTLVPTTIGEVNDSATFAAELAKVLVPFNGIVNAVLNGGELKIAGLLSIEGENAYVNAVKPLLEVLGCNTVVLNAMDDNASIEGILKVVLARVDEILDSTNLVSDILEMVPDIANFVAKGGIQKFIEELIYPVIRIINPIADLLGVDSVFDIVLGILGADVKWNDVQNNVFEIVASILKANEAKDNIYAEIVKSGIFNRTKSLVIHNININSNSIDITVPEFDLAKLAGADDGKGHTAENTLVMILRYVWAVVDANEDAVVTVLKGVLKDNYSKVETYINNLFDNSDDDVVIALIGTLNALDSALERSDAWAAIRATVKEKPVSYTAKVLSRDDVTVLVNNVSNIVNNALPKLLPSLIEGKNYKSLQALVAGELYTQSLINTIANALNGLGYDANGNESELNKTLKNLVGIDFTAVPTGDKIGTVKNKETFINALVKVLEPLNPVVDALLKGTALEIAGIAIGGENGYVYAIKPLLQVLGCKNIEVTVKDSDPTLKGILTVILNRVDEILADPVTEVLEMLPQLANFIDKGGIQIFIEEFIYPVVRIASPIVSLVKEDNQNVFDFVLDVVSKFVPAINDYIPVGATWSTLQNYIFDIIAKIDIKIPINGKTYKLVIPALDLKALAGCGTGTGLNYNANKADVATVLLRYVWDVVQANKTDFIIPMLKSLLGNNYKNFGEYIEKALANKADVVIKALADVFENLDSSAHKADWSFLYKNYKSTNVKYPNGVTAKDLEKVVEILSIAVNNALEIFLGKSLDDLVPGMIYTDSLVNTLAKAIGSLKSNKDLKDIFALLGVDFSKVNYNQKWNVTDKRSFAKALATILSPFNNLLAVLLNAGELNLEGIIELRGANGYENAIKPLLDVLGCNTVSASKYKSDALKNSNNLLLNILNPLLDRVDEILANPIEEVIDLLPAIANFINKGGIQYFVEELIYPLINIVNPIVKLVTNDNVFDFVLKLLNKLGVIDINITWKNAQNQIIPLVNTFLTNIKIGGKSYKITVPNIDWAVLGGCGKVSGNAIIATDGDVLLTLLRYIFKVLDANKNMIFDLVGGKNSTIGQIVNNILKQGADGMAKIVVTILLKMETFDNVKWTFKNIKELVTTYTEHLGEAEYFEAIGQLDEMIAKLLGDFLNISLDSVLGDLVYTNSIINTVAKLIYTNIEKVDIGIDLNTILKVVDLDVSTKGVASILKDYSSASREIGRHTKWSEVNFDSLNWGFTDGNRDGFVNALSAILRPIQPILRVILSGEDLIVLGSIQIKGGNGYNTAIIPLLEAFDINPSNLVSPQQYAKEASTDKVLTNILNPLLDKVEELTHGPIDTLTKILPNLAYFVYNGGVQDIAENLIAPVTNILHEIDPIYSLNIDLSMLGDVDLAGLLNGILSGININGQPLGIVLPDIDLATLAGRGSLVTYRSARTYFGKQMDCKKINADQAAVFISVLRYIVQTLKDNLDNIKKLLEGLGLSGDIANMIANVLGMLTSMDVDGVIEALMNMLFGYDIGGGEASKDSESGKNSLVFGDFSWLYQIYWVIFAITVLILIYFLYLLFGKKDEDEEDPENPEGPNPPEAPSEEQETYKDNNKQGDMI